jgi:hypothetical protein
MAGAGSKLFTSGSVLTASDVNTYLMDQTIMKFTSTTTRDAAFGGAGEPTLAEGMFAYTTDTNTLWLYDGSNWVNVLGSDIGAQALSNRNVIINGAMQIAQRGTSTASITANGYFTADRWAVNMNALGTWTQSIETDAPTGSGFRNSLKMLVTTADASPAGADVAAVEQLMEGQNLQQFAKGTSSAKQFSVSFWVKSNVTGTYILLLLDNDNNRICSASYTISASATWEKKTITLPSDTTGAFDNDNALSLRCRWYLAAGTDWTSGTLQTTWASNVNANRAVGQTNVAAAINNYWQITGVQLEAGAVATPFEFEDYGTTLAKCQRYYWRVNGVQGSYTGFLIGSATGTTSPAGRRLMMKNPVEMRTAPALNFSGSNVQYGNGDGTYYAVTALNFNSSSTFVTSIDVNGATALTAGQNFHLIINSVSSSDWFEASAEL